MGTMTGCSKGDQSTASGPGQAEETGVFFSLAPQGSMGPQVADLSEDEPETGLGDFLTLGQYKRKISPQPLKRYGRLGNLNED